MKKLARKFAYNQIELEDLPGLSPEEVMVEYSNIYPELTQAVVEGPEYTEEAQMFTFRRTVGTKGSSEADMETLVSGLLSAMSMKGEPILPPSEVLEVI